MVRKLVRARNLMKQRQSVSQRVVVQIDAIPKPRTKRIGKRSIGGKDGLLQMMMIAATRPPAVVSLNPAYNMDQSSAISSQLNNLTVRLEDLRAENIRLRSGLDPRLIRESGNIRIEAPSDEQTLQATERVNENVNAMKEIMSAQEQLKEEARRNAIDWMQDRETQSAKKEGREPKPVAGFQPPTAEELKEAMMRLKPTPTTTPAPSAPSSPKMGAAPAPPPPPPPPEMPPIEEEREFKPQPPVSGGIQQGQPTQQEVLRDDEIKYIMVGYKQLKAAEVRKYAKKLNITITGDLRGKKIQEYREKIYDIVKKL